VPDLVDEVDEEIRQERAALLARRFGGLFAALAMFVLAAVGGWQGWQWYENRNAAAAAEAFLAATRDAAAEGADTRAVALRMAALGAGAPNGYRILSQLRAAALTADAGDGAAALAMWDRLSADSSADPLYRELATLLWGLHALAEGAPRAAEVQARLAPLTARGPWRASAREIVALAALAAGNTSEARRGLTELARDDGVPQGVRERAQRLLSGIDG
jgi:hypothetical protein